MITVYGYLGDINSDIAEHARRADLVAGGRRQLDALGVPEEKAIVIARIAPVVEQIKEAGDKADIVVLASGDPLLYGIVRSLRRNGLAVKVVPAVSSIQAAFAAVALPWDDARIASAHGHSLEGAQALVRSHPKVAVLTAPKRTIVDLVSGLQGLGRTYVLCERLGESNERVRILTEDEALAVDNILEPNLVLALAHHPDSLEALGEAAAVAGAIPTPAEGSDDEDDDEPKPLGDIVIGHVYNGRVGRERADAIDAALKVTSRRWEGMSRDGLVEAWGCCDIIVSHLALGATTRLIAPLLKNKKTDPGVVVVDEVGRFAVPLVGGHAGGANAVAKAIAEGTGAIAVLTTATDALGIPALDTLGWGYSGDVAGVTRALIDGRPVLIEKTQGWPLPPLPGNVGAEVTDPVARIVVSDLVDIPASELPTVVLRPKSLVVGMGCNAGVSEAELTELLDATLAEAGLVKESISALTSIDVKAGELGLIQLANTLGVPYRTYPAEELAVQPAPSQSDVVSAAVGTGSVSEASVMVERTELIVPKQKSAVATCAIGRRPARGKLSVVGLGPGARQLLTPMAVEAIRNATFVVGYGPYVRQIRDLVRPGARIHISKMGTEEERTRLAIDTARNGENVAFVCSGDPAVYAMASPTLEMGTDDIDIAIIPGVTAALAASSLLGAPFGHDNATISLSDLHTSWEIIEKRLQAAAEGDLVVALYNPRSRKRRMHLPRALEILGQHRPTSTPVAVVQQAYRAQQKVTMSTLADFQPEWVDMNSIVIVGSSTTKYVSTGSGERVIVTPRDYQWMEKIND
ncbi:MAG: precorrin-3B C(17)-methyltransferase [Propionibacteriaceae bacterium]